MTSPTPKAKWFLAYIAPPVAILVLAIAGLVFAAKLFRPETGAREPERLLPTVEVVRVEPRRLTVDVRSQGTVVPRTETLLVAEVSGRVEEVSPSLFAGGSFSKGDPLVIIDTSDYEAGLAAALSRAAEARLVYEQAVAAAEQARADWAEVGGGEPASPLTLRQPQLEAAKASLDAAESAVANARRDLDRTTVRAPYAGRSRERFVNVGQLANARATQLALIYATDVAEIRLPISLDEAGLIDLPEPGISATPAAAKPRVILEGRYGGVARQWRGVIDRSEGAIDPQLRMLHLVAQVDLAQDSADPSGSGRLPMGLFVTARIQGKELEKAYALPRRALRLNDQVHVVDDDRRIRLRPVTVYQRSEETVIITVGLRPGDLVSLTPLEYAVEGMQVSLEDVPPTQPLRAPAARNVPQRP